MLGLLPARLGALRAHDPRLAEAAALLHVSTTETWFRTVLSPRDPEVELTQS